LPAARCPECGREFVPHDPETMYLPAWPRFLAVRALRRPGWLLYTWPVIAALMTYVLGQWPMADQITIGDSPGLTIVLPRWTRIGFRYIELWPYVIWMWVSLFVVWYVRARMRRVVVTRYRLSAVFLQRDWWLRRFSCAWFLGAVILGGCHTDRCTHGEYWQWWTIAGIAHDLQGDFGQAHAWVHIPMGDDWLIYFWSDQWYRHGW
jgi:hypothetical protein